MDLLERGAPLPPDLAVRLARDLYGVSGRASALPGEYDDNFRIVADDGRAWVLKLLHPGRDRGVVELQAEALRHLARREPQLALPRVSEARGGFPLTAVPLPDGTTRLAWMLSFVPGTPLAEARPHTLDLLFDVGRLLGEFDRGLLDFRHPAARRALSWDMTRAAEARSALPLMTDGQRAMAARFLDLFDADVAPALPGLRRSVIHGDANDWNVLVAVERARPPRAASLIDLGDMHEGLTVAEAAVGAAYALFGERDPLAAAAALVRGYHSACPLQEAEIDLLFPLIGARLAVSVATSARRKARPGHDPYVTISEAPAWQALERLARIPPRLARATFRAACGLAPVPAADRVAAWLGAHGGDAHGVLDADLRREPSLVLDLGVGSLFLGADPEAAETGRLTKSIFDAMRAARAPVGVGRYDEARLLYASPPFGADDDPEAERRTVHLGIDLFVPPGAVVRAPFDGSVHLLARNEAPQDYGPLVVLRHETGDGDAFYTLYGHLSDDTLPGLAVGQRLRRGEAFARVGAPPGNGGWPPHVHFQVILDLLDLGAGFPGVSRPSDRGLFTALSPDPNRLLGIPVERFPAPAPSRDETLRARRALLGRNLSLSYARPLEIVRGFGRHIYDEEGRAYLDVYNNVPLVGHAHPRVVRAVQAQVGLLNTNTRYLHPNAVRYAERLTRLLPEPLRVCFFLNSGSEANELALRLARARTGREDVIVLEHAYHGNTQTLIDVSHYKFAGRGGSGRRPFVHVAPLPDDYRGPYRRGDPDAGRKYAAHVAELIEALHAQGRGPAAFLAETLPSTAGQIVFPPGYLAAAYRHVRAAGGICIADEVQVGFGRLGTHFWGFETQGVVPDVVVLGKPIGNGFPLAAVVTTAEIADAFANGMEFFSTFGGNPVACAAGLAVLDVLAEERLQERARAVGERFKAGLLALADRHALVGDVRGSGLFLGVELVRDRATLEPATEEADYVVNRLRERGILTGTDGPFDNVIKLRPPLVFEPADADRVVRTLDEILSEDPILPARA